MNNAIVNHKINCLIVEQTKKYLDKSKIVLNDKSALHELIALPIKRDSKCGKVDIPCRSCTNKKYTSQTIVDESAKWILENGQEHLSCLQWDFINLCCINSLEEILDCEELVKANISQKIFCNVLINKLEQSSSNCQVIADMTLIQSCNIIDKISQDPVCTVTPPEDVIVNRVCDIIINELKS